VLFILDEFGTIGNLNAVAQAYGLAAGRGMIMWSFSQDLNQLARDYPKDWETFIANSVAVTSFAVMDNFTADYVSKFLGISTIHQPNTSTTHDNFDVQISTSTSTQTMMRPLLHPDEVRTLSDEFCIIMGRFPPIYSRRIVYHKDWDLLHWARPDPQFPRTETVRWRALQRRLREMGSVARLLKEYSYEVKGLRGGRYEVKSNDGTRTHTFANDNDLWRWTYILAMDEVDSA
jgi:type IV secretory pathway TraG/TraD family ATPase VirD4